MISPDTKPKSVALSRFYAGRVQAKPKECWKNAALVAMTCDDPLIYVEGFVYDPDLPPILFEHGWLETDNEIVDPTLIDGEQKYFPAMRYEPGHLIKLMRRNRGNLKLPINLGFHNPDYVAVYHQAESWVLENTKGVAVATIQFDERKRP